MRESTRNDWHEKIQKAISFILDSLDKPIDLNVISSKLFTSPFHFHRKFRELTGEGVYQCIRRLRLEYASFKLRNTYERITDIAMDLEYESLEAFTKSYKSAYGIKPSDVRKISYWSGLLDSKAGIHYRGITSSQWYYLNERGDDHMETKILTLPEKRIVGVENIGAYWGLPKAWDKLHKILGENNLHQNGREWMSVFPDTIDSIPMDDKRTYAAMTVDKDFVNKYGLHEVIIPEGVYAIAVHFGSTENIGDVWDKWLQDWLLDSGWEIDYSRPNLEWYQNQCILPELQLTFMCTSIKKKS